MKTFIKFGNYSLAICLIVVAALLAYVAAPAFGNKALIVRSGSMEPTIKTGDLIVVKIAKGVISPVPNAVSKYKEGDIIAFKGDKDPNVLTTHRIVSKKQDLGKTVYQTQGDANQSPDSQLIQEEQIVGRSGLTIPKAGKIFAFAKTKNGFALLVLIPALLIIAIESSTLIKEIIKIARARRMLLSDPASMVEKNQLFGPVGLRILIPFVVGLMFFHNSYAFFSDSAASLNSNLTAATTFPSPSPTGEASPSALPESSPTPENIANHIVISEVQITGGADHTTEDFIELYNPTSSTINLNGFRLVNRTTGNSSDNSIRAFSVGQNIPAHGYFLWCSEAMAALITCDDSTTDSLSNDGSVAIRQGALDTGTIIDTLSWDPSPTSLKEGTEFSPDPSANQSIERKALATSDVSTMAGADHFKGNGNDTNNNATDFVLKTTSEPQNSISSTETP